MKIKSQENRKTIGIYIPRWLCDSDESDQMFAEELIKTINESAKYEALRLNLKRPLFF